MRAVFVSNRGTRDPRVEAVDLSGHMPQLDGVRGLAIFMVIVYHCSGHMGVERDPLLSDWIFYHLSNAGWLGVNLFFVLSGFLITGILLDSRGSQHYFRTFYIRRSLRIFPVYYLMLVVSLLILPRLFECIDFPEPEAFAHQPYAGWWYLTYTYNFLVAWTNEIGSRATAATWSLAIEEQFYLIWPAVVLLAGPRKLVWVCGGVILMAVVFRTSMLALGASTRAVYVLPFSHMDALAIGALIATWARLLGGVELLRKHGLAALAIGMVWLGVSAVAGQLSSKAPLMQHVGYTIMAVGFGGLVIWALNLRTTSVGYGLLTSTVATRMGKYSYAMYLYHGGLIHVLQAYDVAPEALESWEGTRIPPQLLYIAGITFLSFCLAWLSWYAFESRFLALKRYFPTQTKP